MAAPWVARGYRRDNCLHAAPKDPPANAAQSGETLALFSPLFYVQKTMFVKAGKADEKGLGRSKRNRAAGQWRVWLLLGSMLLSIVLLAALAFGDAERQSEATLEDFSQEQMILASSVAQDLGNRLLSARRDALLAAAQTLAGQPLNSALGEPYLKLALEAARPLVPALREQDNGIVLSVPVDSARRIELFIPMRSLLSFLQQLEREKALIFLIAPPDASGRPLFYSTHGQHIASSALKNALTQGKTSVILPREDAAQLGLPPRMALAGLARFEGGPLGTWHVAAVSSALRERDRNRRARLRAVLGVLLASGLVLAFGGAALYLQRKELLMEQELAILDLIRERDEKLLGASKAATMGTLALGITHELSTPLGVITGRTEQLLSRLSGDERTTRSLEVILEQANHIGQIIRGFLGLVRGHHPPTEPLSPAEIVRGAVALCEHRFAKAQVELSTSLAADLPLIRGELRLLEHALINLLLNACDACKKGDRVELVLRAEEGWIAFAVLDRGVGISVADAERALEPFFTTKPAEEGTGLGLAIAQEIVKNHRGTLYLGPRPGGGTCATFRIPIWQGSKE